jgi:hypothetical protein
VQKHDDKPKSTVPDCHNLFFVRLAESIGRLAGEWLAKRDLVSNRSQDASAQAAAPATTFAQPPINSAGVIGVCALRVSD